MTILTIIVLIAAIVESTDVFENFTFNPFGNFLEPKVVSDDDPREREYTVIYNDNEPSWGTVNFGSIDALKTTVVDDNGLEGHRMGESPVMKDMSENATVASQVKPTPKGLTIHVLPGVQPDGKLLNSFVFAPQGGDKVMAPRNYYLSKADIKAKASNSGAVTQNPKNIDITIMQVPYGMQHFITDTTGTVKDASSSEGAAKAITETLNELSKLSKDKAGMGQLSNLLFGSKGLSTEFNNINNMINTGRYAEAYKYGLSAALGKNDEGQRSLPAVAIKSDLPSQDVYAQFDYIYTSMLSGAGSAVYSPELVKWAQDNAESITHLLMVNYMLQSQFQGSSGSYATPIRLGNWGETKLTFYKDLAAKGRKSKEPFYLYTVIDPAVQKVVGDTKVLPTIPTKYIQPDLSYIFSLYTAIMSQVWVGAHGVNTDGWISQTWQDVTNDMDKRVSKNPVKSKKDLPKNANKVTNTLSHYSQNNLVSGLSTSKGTKDKTEEVYPNKELVGALRALLSAGEDGNGSSSLILGGKKYDITPLSETKYTKSNRYSYLYDAFRAGGGDTFRKWESMIHAAQKTPLQPAIFKSYWDNNTQHAYVMMPIMLGKTDFPEAMLIMMNDLLKKVDDPTKMKNLSYANRYIMAFNFTSDAETKTTNKTGVVEVDAGKSMGKARDSQKPIILTGYNGGQSFSIIDYFKVQDALNSTMDLPPIEAKTVEGKYEKLRYLNLFKDFFTIPTEKDFVTGSSPINYTSGFDKQGYQAQYQNNSSKSAVHQISPNYSVFFGSADVD